jgi:hypothetical protein
LASVVRGIEAELRKHGARTQAQPTGLLFVEGRLPGSALATFVLESERVARAVVTQIAVPPFVTGIAVVVHPRAELAAPLLIADLMLTPTGRGRALLDAAGPAIGRPSFREEFGEPLAQVVDRADGVRASTVPAWLAPFSGGGGGTLRSDRGQADALADALARYVATYLSALDGASRADDRAAASPHATAARAVRDLVRANGSTARWLARSFGERVTERYQRLFWREDLFS